MSEFPAPTTARSRWRREVVPVLERCAFALYLAAVVAGAGLIGLGLFFALGGGDWRPLGLGLASAVVAGVLKVQGYRAWHFARWEESLEPRAIPLGAPGQPEWARTREFEEVIRELEDASGDTREVWAVQDLRHRARALLAEEPSLRQTCARDLERHPELWS